MGKSPLPRRSDGSKRRVTGLNGPSRVVGIRALDAIKSVVKIKMVIGGIIHFVVRFIVGFLFLELIKMVRESRKMISLCVVKLLFFFFLGIFELDEWNIL